MKTNWRGEPAKRCWMCGSSRTKVLDHHTRECRSCGNWYSVFDAVMNGQEKTT